MDWLERASCRGMDTDIFFLERGDTFQEVEAAKSVCCFCPVVKDCLNYALDRNITYGIYGGLAPTERRIERRRREKLNYRPRTIK
jgi:WhiB family redox-sensing transcriptional regulator